MATGFVALLASAPIKPNLLPVFLTTEGLLFAALTVGVSLTASSTFGHRPAVSPAVLAFVAAGVLTVVAIAAGLAWTDRFTGSTWPADWSGRFQATALLFAIAVQPVVALLVALGIARS